MMKLVLLSCLVFLSSLGLFAQQTVGLFSSNDDAYSGYTLFAPANSDSTFLIDNCGDLNHSWTSAYRPGNSVYLLEGGLLLRACKNQNGSPLDAGGAGGRIEAIRYDDVIEWSLNLANDTVRQHHDIEPLPNGNILIVAWEYKSQADAIAEGRDPSIVSTTGLWPDHILEYSPGPGTVVWEWHAWDHLVQDFDAGKPNFGVVSDHPELFDLNFDKGNSAADWQHINSVAYNADLDQIVICSPAWNEIYFIDHSTTSLEAASHSGGLSGKGGDILWRWGNPEMYGRGDSTNRQLFGQHDAHWIPSSYRHGGKIILYNNGKGRTPDQYSTADIIAPVILVDGSYDVAGDGTFLPAGLDYSYAMPTPTDFYSHIISGADMLPNGNIIICEGTSGHYFEVDSMDNIVWDYVNPVVRDSILTQEQVIPGAANLFNSTFRVRKYGHDYPGLAFLPLVNTGPIELNPYASTCNVAEIAELGATSISVYPNPTNGIAHIDVSLLQTAQTSVQVYNALGQLVYRSSKGEVPAGAHTFDIDFSNLDAGIYLIDIVTGDKKVTARVSNMK